MENMCSQDKEFSFFLLLSICLLGMLAAGCAVENNRPMPTDSISNDTPFPTVVTSTVTVTASPTMTSLPTITSTPTPVSIVLPAVTMSPQEAENALQELLKTNGNCTGKCLAGIHPDEMTVQKAVDQMARWGMLRMSDKDERERTYVILVPNSKQTNINLSIGMSQEAGYGVSFHIPRYEYGEFLEAEVWVKNREAWKAFQFGNLIKAYGSPSFVGFMMQTSGPEERTVLYSLYIVYKQLNLEIGIGGLAHMNGQDVFICPSKDPHSLGIDINPEISLGVPVEKLQQISSFTWQDLTNSDLQTFYQTFTDDSNPDKCVTTTLKKIMELDPYFR